MGILDGESQRKQKKSIGSVKIYGHNIERHYGNKKKL